MFDISEMTRIVGLQAQSYALLRWVGAGVRRSALNFGVVHGAMSEGEAAREWLSRNRAGLPQEMRVTNADLPEFACLFASYLTTSFTLKETPALVRRSDTGCYCAICSRLEAANVLVARQPDKKAQNRSREMKQLYVAGIAREIGAALSVDQYNALLTDADLAYPLAYATYGRELLRRSKFASQGEGVMVLWREIAWTGGKANKEFVLSADTIVASETALVERLYEIG